MNISNQNYTKEFLVDLYNDNEISAIFVNAPDQIYVKHNDELQTLNSQFMDNEVMWKAIDYFLLQFNQKYNPDLSLNQIRLPDGAWFNLLTPPTVRCGPVLAIRKARKDVLTIDALIRFGCISSTAVDFLAACVKASLNILVSGGANSGKTTALNVLASFIPADSERIITIERISGLSLTQKHVVNLIASPNYLTMKNGLSMADLVENSTKMMADRIIVSEIEDSEIVPLLQIAAGTEGILASIYANDPGEALTRLELLMSQSAPSIPVKAQRQMIADGFDIIVQLNRLRDGSRKFMKISEVAGLKDESIILSDIFVYQETGMEDGKILGQTIATGYSPAFLPRLHST
jgi:pilus assembly protein CpaF